ncbi:hypothetical protein [Cognataquiflexum rubidum]|uniref:hypothetical protein n=1 Tax=Cognataquiflexum rubidum TaxID=2922273 RepID=UPI001F12DBC3|nr:hypothetical protein [Cognataquiflexum rubidum]MCH6234327.1 hypothetical protein [Cognataquiflexum rubidum]
MFYIIFSGFLPRFLKLFEIEVLMTLLLVSYSIAIVLIGENSFSIPYVHIIWYLECFLIPTFFLFLFRSTFSWLSWETIIVHVGLLAALITIFLILNPVTNLFVRNSIIIDSLDSISSDNWDFRGFTIAESSSYGYGIIQGLILAICILSIKKNLMFLIPILFLFISIIFNARVGIAPVAISIMLLILSGQLSLKSIFLVSIIILIGYNIFLFSSFSEQNETSLIWGLSIFNDANDFIQGKESNAGYNILFTEMLFLPTNFSGLFFGNGQKVFASSIRQSDVGYVIQIFRGGLVYLSIMMFFLFFLFRRCLKINPNKLLPILFFLTIIVANIKGDALFNPSGFFRLFAFYYVYSVFASKNLIVNNFLLKN